MKSWLLDGLVRLALLALLSTLNAQLSTAFAQGTAFTYQGRLNDGGSPANGSYDLRFAVYDSASAGTQQGPTLTNSGAAVSNGLFTVTLDFGNVLPGANRWLEIGVRSNGAAGFFTLSPRQALTPAPYAITAGNVVSGGLASGTYGNAVTFNNPANQFTGTFTGNGANVTNVNAATLGGLAAANFWQLGGNSTTGQFLGTVNNQPLDLYAGGVRAMRLNVQADAGGTYSNAPNVVGGSPVNLVKPGTVGATVGGGGGNGTNGLAYPNQVNANFGTISGGLSNTVSGVYAFIGGGLDNTASQTYGAIGGGYQNTVNNAFTSVGGGFQNTASGPGAAVGGGLQNAATRGFATVAGGANNAASGVNSGYATVGGGYTNTASGDYSTVAGGYDNTASGYASTAMGFEAIANGYASTAMGYFPLAGAPYSTAMGSSIATGTNSVALGYSSATNSYAAAMGNSTAGGQYSTAMGQSTASGYASTAMGQSSAPGVASTAMGGSTASGALSTAMGESTATGQYSTAMGYLSEAGGFGSVAAGVGATATDGETFVWSDGHTFSSTALYQFLIYASGGVGIGLNNPAAALHVASQTTGTPQVQLTQQNASDSVRLRMSSGGNLGWEMDVAAGSTPQLQFWYIGAAGPRVTFDTSGNVFAAGMYQTSDRNTKENFSAVDAREMLAKVATLPITRWNYKADTNTVHVGPMAQDFHAVFQVGPDDKHIATVDEEGVALAAIQGLNQKLTDELRRRDAENADLKARLEKLEKLLAPTARTPL